MQRFSDKIVARGNNTPGLTGLFNSSGANTPWLYLDIDRTKCMVHGVQVSDIFNTLQVYLGSYYVNNFNEYGRTWQVNVQADPRFRRDIPAIRELQVRNSLGQMVRLGTLLDVRDTSGPVMVLRYNMYSAAAVNGNADANTSSGQAVSLMQEIADKELPRSMATEWTELAFLQLQAGNSAMYFFFLAVVFVFLVLAAQYESWKLPLAVILVVPMCLFCSVVGLQAAGMEMNIFTQIGFVVLVGLASKNAILIVEFAKQQHEVGVPRWEATLEACRLRLRPILMTSFAFILGVVPLVVARGAGAEMRRALGLAVFSGMLGVTFFGIFLTPVFFYAITWFGQKPSVRPKLETAEAGPTRDGRAGEPGTPAAAKSGRTLVPFSTTTLSSLVCLGANRPRLRPGSSRRSDDWKARRGAVLLHRLPRARPRWNGDWSYTARQFSRPVVAPSGQARRRRNASRTPTLADQSAPAGASPMVLTLV